VRPKHILFIERETAWFVPRHALHHQNNRMVLRAYQPHYWHR